MEQKVNVIETIIRLFSWADQRKWNALQELFDDNVFLDYHSLSHVKAAFHTPKQIVNSWKAVLPGFDSTHHHLGNFLVDVNSEAAKASFYGSANHYLKNDSGNNLWTVVGTYDLLLLNQNFQWKVSKMKFNLKYTDGNTELPKYALERLSKK
jgi:hypothetical protein